ncbi:hypothetical protein C8R45DRAFT_1077016 [Mycena sanguinolenta]|nr:hypothetical protein C8R45DRAFT_1077016 [Mycena sanguinolenta]
MPASVTQIVRGVGVPAPLWGVIHPAVGAAPARNGGRMTTMRRVRQQLLVFSRWPARVRSGIAQNARPRWQQRLRRRCCPRDRKLIVPWKAGQSFRAAVGVVDSTGWYQRSKGARERLLRETSEVFPVDDTKQLVRRKTAVAQQDSEKLKGGFVDLIASLELDQLQEHGAYCVDAVHRRDTWAFRPRFSTTGRLGWARGGTDGVPGPCLYELVRLPGRSIRWKAVVKWRVEGGSACGIRICSRMMPVCRTIKIPMGVIHSDEGLQGYAAMAFIAMNDAHRNFDRATNWHHSTANPNPTSTTAFYPSFHGGFPADTAAWKTDQFVQTWPPNAIGTTAGPTKQPRYSDARPKSPYFAPVDPLTNGVDAVSTAFLQFVELHERSQLDKLCSDLLRLSLSNGCLAPDELLGVVDWERLRNLAEKSLSRAFTPLVPSPDGGMEPWSHFPRDDVFSVPSTASSSNSLLTPGTSTLVDPVAHPSDPGARPSAEHEQSLSKTPHTGTIMDSAGHSRRRCSNCGVDDTAQWRMHPQIPGFLCNPCGQHQGKHGRARSLQTISRGTRRPRTNHKGTRAMPTRSAEEM